VSVLAGHQAVGLRVVGGRAATQDVTRHRNEAAHDPIAAGGIAGGIAGGDQLNSVAGL